MWVIPAQKARALLSKVATALDRDDNEAMTETARQRQHRETMADILRIAHQQLAREGAAALSLRAIARELGLVSSAIYRYVPSRDELLTLLIEESYNAFGDAVEAAESRCRRDDLGRRWLAIGRSVRRRRPFSRSRFRRTARGSSSRSLESGSRRASIETTV